MIKKSKGVYFLDLEDFVVQNISNLLKTDEHRVITRLLSTALRHGVPISFISQQLQKAEGSVVDFSKAILRILKKYKDEFSDPEEKCPECGSTDVLRTAGCIQCLACNTSRCE
jgi:ribonucleoside-diphosphate reductase alpha chain